MSFDIVRGECLGLVGESGCGKTVTSKIIMRTLAPDAGEVLFNSNGRATDVLALAGDALLDYRRKVQYIFQDPFGSLNPRMTVFDIVGEPLIIHKIGTPDERPEMVKELMRQIAGHCAAGGISAEWGEWGRRGARNWPLRSREPARALRRSAGGVGEASWVD